MDIPFKNKNNFKKQITCFGYSKNEKEKTMSKNTKNVMEKSEEIKELDFMDSLKSNEQLRTVLLKARSITKNLTSVVVPQMATAIKSLMTEANSGKVEIKDWNTMKYLRGHCSEELVEIVPSTINKIWSAEYPTVKRPNAKNSVNITRSLKEALNILENLQNICESKNPSKIVEKISDEDAGVIGSFGLIDFNKIRDTFSKYEENLSGEITEKVLSA